MASGGGSEWDYEWDASMGVLPTERGWERVDTSGTDSYANLSSGSLYIYAKNSNKPYTIDSEATPNAVSVLEAEFSFSGTHGIALMYLSDGGDNTLAIRAQYTSNYKGIYLWTTSSISGMRKLLTISQGTWYTVRLVLDGTYGQVYINDQLYAGDVDLSTIQVSLSHIRLRFTSDSTSAAGSTRLMSTRIKLGRT